jgi:hypothetical protein
MVVRTDIFGEQSSQVPFVEGNHVIQEIAAAAPYPALGDPVLPRATDRRSDGGESHGFYSALNLGAELRVMTEDQISLPVIVRKCFSQLLRHSTTGWVPGEAEVQNATAVMSDDEETIENSEWDRWNREQIHGGNGFVMIVKKRFPASCRFRAARRSLNPTGNSALGKIEPQLEQFAVDAWRTPGGILGHHAKDQVAHLFADSLPSGSHPCFRQELPIQAKTCTMPADHGSRSDNKQAIAPASPQAFDRDPEQSIQCIQPWTFVLALQDRKLLTQSQIVK